MKNTLIFLFRLWARTGVALGWLRQSVEKNAHSFKNNKRSTLILGDTNIECDLEDKIQRDIYFFGAHNPIESFFVSQMLEEDDVIVDVGANTGFYTLLMAQKAKVGKVFGFEPVPKNFSILKHNISFSPHVHKINLQNHGLWHERDLLENAYEVLPLDEFCQSFAKLDFIKMNIEGAELSALRGAQKTIERLRPQFMIEINRKACERFGYSPDEIFLFFKKLGYQFFQVGDVAERSQWIDSFSHIEQANVFVVNEKRQQKILVNWDSKDIKKHFISLQH